MSIGFSGSFSALGATIGSKGAAAGAGGGGGGPSYDVTDVNFIYNSGNPAAVSYVAMPGGERTFLSFITSFGVNQGSGTPSTRTPETSRPGTAGSLPSSLPQQETSRPGSAGSLLPSSLPQQPDADEDFFDRTAGSEELSHAERGVERRRR